MCVSNFFCLHYYYLRKKVFHPHNTTYDQYHFYVRTYNIYILIRNRCIPFQFAFKPHNTNNGYFLFSDHLFYAEKNEMHLLFYLYLFFHLFLQKKRLAEIYLFCTYNVHNFKLTPYRFWVS